MNGQADILITEDQAFTFYSSLGPRGFNPPVRILNGRDEEASPNLIFADAAHGIFLADMAGDGLSDIVRVRQGEVSYLPSKWYRRFDAKISMDGAP